MNIKYIIRKNDISCGPDSYLVIGLRDDKGQLQSSTFVGKFYAKHTTKQSKLFTATMNNAKIITAQLIKEGHFYDKSNI